ncbi:asparagine synthase (glutamine-hydrolyzing) [Geosporobacter ferrireducens]|uniref:asparagine synthase (glutamine-hydrolyzing) n=1 Tax=Geosporobacter ferrireducens TaxID=1424294 RepID=A0A1D8GMP3_9FIRM|nr:asparagine synthase (glutamine-hydrolyzing) [Geosporobacter ferrireducens]AOT72155.1 asparagine synthase (glutamine-hydrolyzing) [Geosporobacter ferrireducens]MTI56043.1 asparagine synthase (glutamine-hydrolyzing) [Geosporobacter ferrireducens]
MCGLTGWISWEGDCSQQYGALKKMTDLLSYRGPDTEGTWIAQHAALGHRRLAVVDPTGGGQPMVRYGGEYPYVIIYNGELYNTLELRQNLEELGYSFQSNSDTEVLLTAYMEWGPGCVERFNGIFAFAIWSERDQRVFLARDRLGVKPLFYMHQGDRLLFASEPKSILAHPSVRAEIDQEGIAEVFVLGPARTPGHGVYKGMKELRPGHCMLFDRNGPKVWKFWSLKSEPHQDDFDTTVDRIQELLKDTVIRQLVADVPVCTFLSGGVDSSAISAYAASAFKESGVGQLHTYSIDYVDNDRHFKASEFQPNSDADYIQLVSRYLDTIHHNIYVDTPQLVEALEKATEARDLPGMADIDSSLYLFCKEIKKEATVALSGECADEMFGGYPWFRSKEGLENNTFPWARNLQDRLKYLRPEIKDMINGEAYLARRYEETIQEVPRLPGESPEDARRREIFYLNITWFMTTLLDRKDRMSMATGLEVRVPFCDHRLMEYVWNIPWEMKYCDNIEKGILRRALKGILPEEVLYRRKSPYPKTHNPNYLEAVKKILLEILSSPNEPIHQLVDGKGMESMIQKGEIKFDRPWFGQLMTGPQMFAYLIQMNTWLKKYKVTIL